MSITLCLHTCFLWAIDRWANLFWIGMFDYFSRFFFALYKSVPLPQFITNKPLIYSALYLFVYHLQWNNKTIKSLCFSGIFQFTQKMMEFFLWRHFGGRFRNMIFLKVQFSTSFYRIFYQVFLSLKSLKTRMKITYFSYLCFLKPQCNFQNRESYWYVDDWGISGN